MVKNENKLGRDAAETIEQVLESVTGNRVHITHTPATKHGKPDLIIRANSGGKKFLLVVEAKKRITPQTALSTIYQAQHYATVNIPVIYAPVISPRVAEIARQNNVGYFDQAGNCYVRAPKAGVLIVRQGFVGKRHPPKPAIDLFAPKSSRIIRLMLSRPAEGWRITQLAKHLDVRVSPGLVTKVKNSLAEESYAIVYNRLLYLRDPQNLLDAWSAKYTGPAEQRLFYLRGDAANAEKIICDFCHGHKLTFALAGLSAAWEIAPEVRQGMATIYIEARGWHRQMLESLETLGLKRVDTGANVQIWLPYDESVFAGRDQARSNPATSPIQTYLDIKRFAGRGEDAARTIFDKYLRDGFIAAAKQAEELKHGHGPKSR